MAITNDAGLAEVLQNKIATLGQMQSLQSQGKDNSLEYEQLQKVVDNYDKEVKLYKKVVAARKAAEAAKEREAAAQREAEYEDRKLQAEEEYHARVEAEREAKKQLPGLKKELKKAMTELAIAERTTDEMTEFDNAKKERATAATTKLNETLKQHRKQVGRANTYAKAANIIASTVTPGKIQSFEQFITVSESIDAAAKATESLNLKQIDEKLAVSQAKKDFETSIFSLGPATQLEKAASDEAAKRSLVEALTGEVKKHEKALEYENTLQDRRLAAGALYRRNEKAKQGISPELQASFTAYKESTQQPNDDVLWSDEVQQAAEERYRASYEGPSDKKLLEILNITPTPGYQWEPMTDEEKRHRDRQLSKEARRRYYEKSRQGVNPELLDRLADYRKYKPDMYQSDDSILWSDEVQQATEERRRASYEGPSDEKTLEILNTTSQGSLLSRVKDWGKSRLSSLDATKQLGMLLGGVGTAIKLVTDGFKELANNVKNLLGISNNAQKSVSMLGDAASSASTALASQSALATAQNYSSTVKQFKKAKGASQIKHGMSLGLDTFWEGDAEYNAYVRDLIMGNAAEALTGKGLTGEALSENAGNIYGIAKVIGKMRYGTEDLTADIMEGIGKEISSAIISGGTAGPFDLSDATLAGYAYGQGIDIVNVEHSEAYMIQLRIASLLEQGLEYSEKDIAALNNLNAINNKNGKILQKMANQLYSFDEVIQHSAYDPTTTTFTDVDDSTYNGQTLTQLRDGLEDMGLTAKELSDRELTELAFETGNVDTSFEALYHSAVALGANFDDVDILKLREIYDGSDSPLEKFKKFLETGGVNYGSIWDSAGNSISAAFNTLPIFGTNIKAWAEALGDVNPQSLPDAVKDFVARLKLWNFVIDNDLAGKSPEFVDLIRAAAETGVDPITGKLLPTINGETLSDITNNVRNPEFGNIHSGMSANDILGLHTIGNSNGGVGTVPALSTLFEHGAEAVIPLESDAGIKYLANAMAMAGGSNGDEINVYLNLDGINIADDERHWNQVAEKIGERIAIQTQRRGGYYG